MYTKTILGLVLVLGVMFVGITIANEQLAASAAKADVKDCCTAKMACCTPASACCVGSAKVGCCEKGMKCCEEKRACCNAPQKCCAEGAACCEQSKACCGAAKHATHATSTDSQTAVSCQNGELCKVANTSTTTAKAGTGKSCCSKEAKGGNSPTTEVTAVANPRN